MPPLRCSPRWRVPRARGWGSEGERALKLVERKGRSYRKLFLDLERLFDLPHVEGGERAEGVALFSWSDPDDSVLVVYERPAEERPISKHDVLADVFRVV